MSCKMQNLHRDFCSNGMNNILGIKEKDIEEIDNEIYAIPDACPITKVNLETKIQFEIEQWIHVLTAPGDFSSLNYRSRLADFSQALDTLHKDGNKTSKIAIARTVRMLIMLEAVMCSNISDVFQNSDNKRDIVKFLQKELVNNYPEINKLAGEICNTHIMINGDEKLQISMALIIVLSTALSQCEYQCPTLWEAYSAGRARNELKRKWEKCGWKPNRIDVLITIICYFIRYQSAFGQLSRGTGTDHFLNIYKIINISESLEKGGLVIRSNEKLISSKGDIKNLFKDTLKIFGIIQEARNKPIYLRFTDNDKNEYKINDIDIHLGVKYKFKKGIKPLKDSIKLLLEEKNVGICKVGYTWSFARWLKEELGDDKETVFKEMIESYIRNKYPDNQDISAISFGRSQLLDIKYYLKECVKAIQANKSSNNSKEKLEGRWNTNLLKVPHWHIAGGEEKVVELQLKDEIQGLALLNFPLKDINRIVVEGKVKTNDSGELFIFLFDNVAKKYNQFDEKKERDIYGIIKGQTVYMPMPIIKRILDVVYRLRPSTCLPIYLSFRVDGSVIGRQEIIYIPQDIKKPDNKKPDSYKPVFEKKIEIYSKSILKYVYGYVLNAAMTSGFRNCDISWHNVESAVINNKSQKVDWIEMSKKIYDEDSFDALLGDYLMKYNTEREAVEKRAITESTLIEEVIEEVKIKEIPWLFGEFLESKNIKNKKNILGIDIGGTLIKFCLYKYEDKNKESKINIFSSGGEDKTFRFRILTKPPGERENSEQFTKRIVEAIKNNAIASNIIKEIKENVSAVGITWPGAVREDRIYGFSGILKKFQGFEKKPKDMPVQVYWEFKVVEDFEKAWKKEFQTQNVPTVTLLNDGDAEATGALYQRSLNTRKNDHKNGRDVAVIKLGTGTAGAYFKDGKQTPGLKEWGKVLLDTGRTDVEFYPAGVANLYLSQRTMPRLGKDRYGMFNRGSEAESSEMGKALEIATNKKQKKVAEIKGDNRKKVKELLKETGLKQYASSKVMEGIEIEALREVLNQGKYASTAVFDEIQLRVGELGYDVQNKLSKKEIPFYGTHRLSQLLDCEAQDIKDLKSINKKGEIKLGGKAHRPFIYFIDSSKKAAETMGIYLGDFIVLLYDHYGVSDFIIGGGVLSGKSGDTAMGKAVERVKFYFNSSKDNWNKNKGNPRCKVEWVERFEKKWINIERQKEMKEGGDFATIGAAVHAAGQTLKCERELGIAEIKRRVSELEPTEEVVLENGSIRFGENIEYEIKIAKYALTLNDVKNYLAENGPAIGLYYSSEEGEGKEINKVVKYIRWIIR